MAEYMLVRDARQMLYPIPDNVSFEDAVLTDTIATALRALTQSALRHGRQRGGVRARAPSAWPPCNSSSSSAPGT